VPASLAPAVGALDAAGFTVIPPSGTLRDLTRVIPHIMDGLGFRIIQLLPIGPVPTTHARMGRFGSPYAQLDLTSIDPALVEHDRRTTAVDQFRELVDAVHDRDGLVLLDVVLNHTGWCSRLLEEHPEWFVRNPDGTFKSPGAWGTTWADLVELDQGHVSLWQTLADSLVTWCRRGVDGFRCDAGYMVPPPAWQLVIARVRSEFPNAVFLLEGLGGSWEATKTLLTEGGMQWAYSELFQNYSGQQVSGYLDHAMAQSARVGLLVHYAETHDNDRLAKKGRAWSLLRNRLSALSSQSGGYAITAGVEWLATEKIDVHEGQPLGFGRASNIVVELTELTRLLAHHACFFDGAAVERVSPEGSPVLALARTSADGTEHVLVLANLDPDASHDVELASTHWLSGGAKQVDLLGGTLPHAEWSGTDRVRLTLEPARVGCLSASAPVRPLIGDEYRRARAQAAWALEALGATLPHESIGPADFRELAAFVSGDPKGFLGSLHLIDAKSARTALLSALRDAHMKDGYAPVVTWRLDDARRITLLPPDHWLLIVDPSRFEVDVEWPGVPRRQQSTEMAGGHVVAIPPLDGDGGDVLLTLDRYADDAKPIEAIVRRLPPQGTPSERYLETADRVLLTNGRGGMARLAIDLGRVTSKYDCLLGANLHSTVPTDRHVLVKRARVWANADGFITALDSRNAVGFEPGPPAGWSFAAQAGDGQSARIDLEVALVPGENTARLRFSRPRSDPLDSLPEDRELRLTVRLDIEDRSYHAETERNPGSEAHFSKNVRVAEDGSGFEFRPADDRRLVASVDHGTFHASPEWQTGIRHSDESARGLRDHGDAYSPGWFDLRLNRGDAVVLRATAEATSATPVPPSAPDSASPIAPDSGPPSKSRRPRRSRRGSSRARAPGDEFVATLREATRAYLVRRGSGTTVVAGYPWFLDWGRDAFIAARGLVAGDFTEEARSVLRTFGRFEVGGTLPNFLAGESPGSRESSDAPLWFALACDDYVGKHGEDVLAELVDERRSLVDVLTSIATHYVSGTETGVGVDPESGLVWSPAHFTWMDTNYPAGTPREGYPIELSALFARLTALLERIGAKAPHGPWRDWAARTHAALSLFRDVKRVFLSDTLHAARGVPALRAKPDDHLRPNQLFAVTLGFVEGEEARRVVGAVERNLLVPGALRTLAPRAVETPLPVARGGILLNDPGFPYWGRYEGDEDTRRKPAYHNGTAWPWLLPTYCEALVSAYPRDTRARDAARAVLGSSARLLDVGTARQLPEILDGDAPHTPRGCDAQAWSVTETLRVALLLDEVAS
jgi:glycogen debranching enzyme